ncbi:NAD(+) synthase, partial [Candidatus Marithrix sp. Canyon 246]
MLADIEINGHIYPIGDVSYIYTNLLGNEAGRAIYDGDAMIASNNNILATSSRFSFDNYQSISACINIAFEYPVISPCKNIVTTTITDIIKSLLTCVYQATENSSETTQNAANTLATSLGADYLNININNIYIEYVELISQALNKKLSWETDDLALQNIQARVRSPSVWLIANIRNALLLATSNRSEVALGYVTMDGDTSGGLSPLAGIDKDFLRHWLRWLEKSIPALRLVNEQSPTAELRPA